MAFMIFAGVFAYVVLGLTFAALAAQDLTETGNTRVFVLLGIILLWGFILVMVLLEKALVRLDRWIKG